MRITIRILLFFFLLYAIVCTLIYFNQNELLFHPRSLKNDHALSFSYDHEEIPVKTSDSVAISTVYFSSGEHPKGLIFFVHGNAGNLETGVGPMEFYLEQGYDFAAYDFRGFGKSKGSIQNEEQFYSDAQLALTTVLIKHPTKNLILSGYSIGSAAAAKLAVDNHAEKLVLMAPYFNMESLAGDHYPFFPSFLLNYDFPTADYIRQFKNPVIFFHGKNDGTISPANSYRLNQLTNKGKVVFMKDVDHNGISSSPVFRNQATAFLKN